MTIEEAIFTRLSASGELTALIGTRSYPVFVPQNGSYPCIVYKVNVEFRNRYSSGKSPLTRCNVEFECWGLTEAQADQIGQILVVAIDDTRLTKWGTVMIRHCAIDFDDGVIEPGIGNDQQLRYAAHRTATIWYIEA